MCIQGCSFTQPNGMTCNRDTVEQAATTWREAQGRDSSWEGAADWCAENHCSGPCPSFSHHPLSGEKLQSVTFYCINTHFCEVLKKETLQREKQLSLDWQRKLRKLHGQDKTRRRTPPQSPVERGEWGLKKTRSWMSYAPTWWVHLNLSNCAVWWLAWGNWEWKAFREKNEMNALNVDCNFIIKPAHDILFSIKVFPGMTLINTMW